MTCHTAPALVGIIDGSEVALWLSSLIVSIVSNIQLKPKKMLKKILVVGADHGGFLVKDALKKYVVDSNLGWQIIDCGVNSELSVDYPHYARKVAEQVLVKTGLCFRMKSFCLT